MKSQLTSVLQILASIGAGFYFFGIIMALIFGPGIDFSAFNTYLLFGTLLIFIVAFVSCWLNKKMAAGIFIFCAFR